MCLLERAGKESLRRVLFYVWDLCEKSLEKALTEKERCAIIIPVAKRAGIIKGEGIIDQHLF